MTRPARAGEFHRLHGIIDDVGAALAKLPTRGVPDRDGEIVVAVLTYVTLLCADVDRLAEFYMDLLGFEEILASRSESYREVLAGGAKIGFAWSRAYAALNLTPRPSAAPVSTVLSFDLGDPAAVDALSSTAVVAGARLNRPAIVTPFGQYQSVLLDPEGNVFRLTAAALQAPAVLA